MKKHIFLFLTTALSIFPIIAQAQTYTPSNRTPQQDNSIGTIVNPAGVNNFNITGGLQRGQNLFHSFTDFSIPTGGAANFTNPQGNQSIITRVTGNVVSDINGTLNTNGANFLLINPKGVVFGTNAQLNVGKAFVTSTASGVDFVDAQGRNYNFGVNQMGDRLLSIAPGVTFNPARLIMNASIPESKGIENYGTLRTNNPGQYIGLIGGDVTINGGRIDAPGGRIDLGGLKSVGTVTTDSQGLVLSGDRLTRGNVLLTNIGQVSVRTSSKLVGIKTFDSNPNGPIQKGSSINIIADNLQIISNNSPSDIRKAGLYAGLNSNSGVQSLPAGDINIDATGKISLDRGAIQNTIFSGASGNGSVDDSRSINLNARELELRNNSEIAAQTQGKGNAGNLNITVTGNISMLGSNDPSYQVPFSIISAGNGGGQGDAGIISITSQGKVLLDKSVIQSSISTIGLGGTDGSSITAGENAVGNSRGISITARELELRNNSGISSQTQSKGNGGDIDIRTIGNTTIKQTSRVSNSSFGQGKAGKISIVTQGSLLLDRGEIQNIIGENAVGNSRGISINTRELELTNSSNIASFTSGKGNSGDINILTTGNLTVASGDLSNNQSSLILNSSFGDGDAGSIFVKSKTITLSNGGILSESINSNGGNIDLFNTDYLLLKNDSLVTTNSDSTGQNGNGGNITINSPLIIALPGNNDITANANQGDGGRVNITSQGLFGIQYRPTGSRSTNDITASSTFGQSGNVQINTPGVDPGKDTGELPAAPNDASRQISQTCSASQRDNKFYITGRGGLPPNASEPQESEALWQDARAAKTKPVTTASQPQKFAPPAIGWIFQKDGRVRLVAAQTAGEPTNGSSIVCPKK
jgi:filamentous hemagglutinin family protein